MEILNMKLVRAAHKNGGDRYEGSHGQDAVIFYVPQSISRVDGKPAENLKITIERS